MHDFARFLSAATPMAKEAGGEMLHAEISAPPPMRVEDQIRMRHAGKRVLMIEDNMMNREVGRLLLAHVGLVADEADNGTLACEMAQQTGYAAILMDLMMPVMDGIETTRRIRAIPGYERTPIIAVTACAFDRERKRCLENGMNDFVTKPAETTVLYATLLRWLDAAAAAPH